MPNIQTVANQKIISIGTMENKRKEPCDNTNIYLRVNKEALLEAMSILTPVNSTISKETGIKKSSLQEGIRVLIKEGYLIQRDNSNVYDFYERQRTKEEIEGCMMIEVHKDKNDNVFIF